MSPGSPGSFHSALARLAPRLYGAEAAVAAVPRHVPAGQNYAGTVPLMAPQIAQLPVDPSLISLAYDHEHPVQTYEFENTLEVWKVSARIDADVLAEELAA